MGNKSQSQTAFMAFALFCNLFPQYLSGRNWENTFF